MTEKTKKSPAGYGPFHITLTLLGRIKRDGKSYEVEIGGPFELGEVPTKRVVRRELRKLIRNARSEWPSFKPLTATQVSKKLLAQHYGPLADSVWIPGMDTFEPWPARKARQAGG